MDTAHNGETSGDRSLDLPIKTLDDKPPIQLLYPGAVFEYGSFPLYSDNRFSLLGRWTLFSNFFIGSLFPEYMANCQIYREVRSRNSKYRCCPSPSEERSGVPLGKDRWSGNSSKMGFMDRSWSHRLPRRERYLVTCLALAKVKME